MLDKKSAKDYEKARNKLKSAKNADDVFDFKDETETNKKDDSAENSNKDSDETKDEIDDKPEENELLEKAKEAEKADRAEKAAKAEKILERLKSDQKSRKDTLRRASVSVAQPQISMQQMEQMAKGNVYRLTLQGRG